VILFCPSVVSRRATVIGPAQTGANVRLMSETAGLVALDASLRRSLAHQGQRKKN
jgi:hypothetical protein